MNIKFTLKCIHTQANLSCYDLLVAQLKVQYVQSFGDWNWAVFAFLLFIHCNDFTETEWSGMKENYWQDKTPTQIHELISVSRQKEISVCSSADTTSRLMSQN